MLKHYFIKDFNKEFFQLMAEINESGAKENKNFFPIFRGVGRSSYELLPKIGRGQYFEKLKSDSRLENNLFREYLSQAHLELESKDSWDVLASMRHHGIPTRLLDWTSSVEVALYFSLESRRRMGNCDEHIAFWLLDGSKLNELTMEEYCFYNPVRPGKDRFDYEEFLKNESFFKANVLCLKPAMTHKRMLAQKSYFTFHVDLTALEKLYPQVLIKIEIEKNQLDAIYLYLEFNEINPRTMFVNLDGLGEHLSRYYFK